MCTGYILLAVCVNFDIIQMNDKLSVKNRVQLT